MYSEVSLNNATQLGNHFPAPAYFAITLQRPDLINAFIKVYSE